VNRAGAGFSYGFMVAFALALSFFLLLCGLVMDGFRPEVQTSLEPKYDTNGTLVSGGWLLISLREAMRRGVLVLGAACFVWQCDVPFIHPSIHPNSQPLPTRPPPPSRHLRSRILVRLQQ
jgi:hypothetical protein